MNVIEVHARSIFLAAVEREPCEWPAFLAEASGDDAELRLRVDQLLRAHQAMGSIHWDTRTDLDASRVGKGRPAGSRASGFPFPL